MARAGRHGRRWRGSWAPFRARRGGRPWPPRPECAPRAGPAPCRAAFHNPRRGSAPAGDNEPHYAIAPRGRAPASGEDAPALGCCEAPERPVPARSCCPGPDHAGILAGHIVTTMRLRAAPGTGPSPPEPPTPLTTAEAARPPARSRHTGAGLRMMSLQVSGCCRTSHPEVHRKQKPRAPRAESRSRPRSCCRRGTAAPPAKVPTTRGSPCNPADTSSSLINVPSRNHPHSRPGNLLGGGKAKSDGMWGYRGSCVNFCANVFTIIRRLAAGGGSNWSIPSW